MRHLLPMFLIITALLTACTAKPPEATTIALDTASSCIQNRLADIDRELSRAASRLRETGLQGPAARKILESMHHATSPFAIDCVTIDPTGKIVEVFPESYNSVLNRVVIDQPQVSRALTTGMPTLSSSFASVEGLRAADAEYPVKDNKGEVIGTLSILFDPARLLGGCVQHAIKNTPVNIWAISTDAIMLYDIMPSHIGQNLFTAPLYEPFPSLKEIGRKIIMKAEGSGTYSFYKPETMDKVTKDARWQSVSLYGTAWRIVAYQIMKGT